ncbi:MAG: hypothetical protein K8963_09890, partial [Proteobacteria bacterium]|nr:hypothetical protein [Pseudomonadota bacterium]
VTEPRGTASHHKNYICVMGQRVAMAEQESIASTSNSPPAGDTEPLFDELYYLHSDALGSLAVIGDQ